MPILNLTLNFAPLPVGAELRQRPLRQPAGGRQRADQFLQHERRHSAGLWRVECSRADAGLRRTRDRLAADDVRCDEPVHGPAHRSVHAAERWSASGSRAPTGFADEDEASAYAAGKQANRRVGDVHQGAAARLRAALERVGRRLRRHAIDRRQCGHRIERYDEQHLRHARSAPTICFRRTRIVGFALAGGGTSFSIANGLGSRPLRPVPGRRLFASQRGPGLHLRARWPMAGRTSPPTAP